MIEVYVDDIPTAEREKLLLDFKSNNIYELFLYVNELKQPANNTIEESTGTFSMPLQASNFTNLVGSNFGYQAEECREHWTVINF